MVALAAVALGLLLLSGISDIGAGAGYDRIGPRVFPCAVAGGLILLGVALTIARARGARVLDTRQAVGLAARGESLAAFDGRCIPGGCVAPPSNTPGILSRRALPAGRLARLGATPDFHHGLLVLKPASVAISLSLALLLYVPLLEYAGFVVATSAQFWLVARAFRHARPGRDAMAALVLAVVVDLLFSRGLGVSLPQGLLRGLL